MLRRDLLRSVGAGALTGLLGKGARAQDTGAQTRPPNILVLVSDDQRWNSVGYEGDPLARTPVLNRLAAEGAAFTNSFVTTPICASSRASIFTSLYYATHGFNFGQGDLDAALKRITYPYLLQQAGYRTGFFGKFGIWFEESLFENVLDVMRRNGVPLTGRKYSGLFDSFRDIDHQPYISPDTDGTERHSLDKIDLAARDFLAAQSPETPFCLSISFNALHISGLDFTAAPTEAELLADARVPPPEIPPSTLEAPDAVIKGRYQTELYQALWATPEARQNVLGYYRLLAGMDRVIGNLRTALEDQGLADNTVIIFLSDNGMEMGDRGLAGKWTHFDESLRVPLIIHDPRLETRPEGRPEEMALNIDIAPTILDYAGLPRPEIYQGRSLRPLVEGTAETGWRTEFLCEHEIDIDLGLPNWIGLRDARYKFATYPRADGDPYLFLHDLVADPDETVNLAQEAGHAERLARMRRTALEYRERYAGAV